MRQLEILDITTPRLCEMGFNLFRKLSGNIPIFRTNLELALVRDTPAT
jgi:hypothetical protein